MSVVAALLSACGGGSSIPISTNSATKSAGAPKGGKTFKYTGKSTIATTIAKAAAVAADLHTSSQAQLSPACGPAGKQRATASSSSVGTEKDGKNAGFRI
jgi:hypothetical protein